jgi:DNA-binding transcriptional MocR family regulator
MLRKLSLATEMVFGKIPPMNTHQPLYHELAERMGDLIRKGTFTSGCRLPSVRKMSREHGVSITTVVEAYGRLEDCGLIEPRARSGYFVSAPKVVNGELPRPARTTKSPVAVKCPDIFAAIVQAVADPGIVPFGTAVPGDGIVPGKRIASLSNAICRRMGSAAYRYSMTPGRLELRTAVARRLLTAGVKAAPDDIVTTLGATEALALVLRAMTRHGDVVAVEIPTYFGVLHLLKDLGLKVVEVPMNAREGIDLDALDEITARLPVKACIVQPSYQNPVGSCMSDASKRRLLELAEARDFSVVEDDLYGELGHAGPRPKALKHFDGHDRVTLCGSVSKCLAPGLRVGWVLPGKWADEVKRLKTIHYPANATVSELVVAEFFKTGGYDRHLRRIGALFARQCAQIREAVLKVFPAGTRVNQPKGGFVLWIEMPPGFDSERFAAMALAKGISLMPGSFFSATCRMKHCLRLSCGTACDERALKAVATLGKLAHQIS